MHITAKQSPKLPISNHNNRGVATLARSGDTGEVFGAHPLPLGVRRRHVVQERVRGPDDRAGARGARVDDGQVVVRLQVVAADVLSVQVGPT